MNDFLDLDKFQVSSGDKTGLIYLEWTESFKQNKLTNQIRLLFDRQFTKENPTIEQCQRIKYIFKDKILYLLCFERIPNGIFTYKLSHTGWCITFCIPKEIWYSSLDPTFDYFKKNIIPLIKKEKKVMYVPYFFDEHKDKGIHCYAIDLTV